MTAAADSRDWRHWAACAGHPEPLWDDRLNRETDRARDARHARAITICDGCPVTAECDAWRDPRDPGVWGGQVHDGPGVPLDLRVQRPPGRPRPAALTPITDLEVRACAGDCGDLLVSPTTWRKHEHLRRHRIHCAKGLCGPCYSRQRRAKIKETG